MKLSRLFAATMVAGPPDTAGAPKKGSDSKSGPNAGSGLAMRPAGAGSQ